MGLLDFDDHYKPPYSPPRLDKDKKKADEDANADANTNAGELNNLGRKKVSRDFEDSPFADRKPLPPEHE